MDKINNEMFDGYGLGEGEAGGDRTRFKEDDEHLDLLKDLKKKQ